MTQAARQSRTWSIPTTLRALTARFMPLVIENQRQYREAVEWIDELAVLRHSTAAQTRYLETLTLLVEAYEERRHKMPVEGLDPVAALRFLLDENGLSTRDLGRIMGDEALGGKILRGERQLSKDHIRKLAAHFAVSPELFF